MKTFRILSSAMALSIALATCSTGVASEKQIKQTVGQTQIELAETLREIRVQASGKNASPALLARVDALVAEIDAMLKTNPSNATELIKLRKNAISVRAQISKKLNVDGTELVHEMGGEMIGEGTLLPAAPGTEMGGPMTGEPVVGDPIIGEQVIGSQVIGSTPMAGGGSFASGGSFSGGGGGGGGGIARGGIGRFATLGLGAAGLAVAIANEDDNDGPGVPASPSN